MEFEGDRYPLWVQCHKAETNINNMNNQKVLEMSLVELNGMNVSVLLLFDGFAGVFRFHFADKSRKNSMFKDYRVDNVYFEHGEKEAVALRKLNFMTTHGVAYATDAMLYVERHKQYLLEEFNRREFLVYGKTTV